MTTTTGSTSQEVLGISADELKGFSKAEIRDFIDNVQDGIWDTLSDKERDEAAEAIYNEANS